MEVWLAYRPHNIHQCHDFVCEKKGHPSNQALDLKRNDEYMI